MVEGNEFEIIFQAIHVLDINRSGNGRGYLKTCSMN
jgi:hypothetical protein